MDSPTADAEIEESSATKWLYTNRGKTHGPVSSADLRAAAHLGFLEPDDLVCRTDDDRWILARLIRGLFKQTG